MRGNARYFNYTILRSNHWQCHLIKYYVYNLSPYQKTIFVDADAIAIPNKDINDLFSECNGNAFTLQNDRRSIYPFTNGKPYSCW